MPMCPKCNTPLRVQAVEESEKEVTMHYTCANRACENYSQEVLAQKQARE